MPRPAFGYCLDYRQPVGPKRPPIMSNCIKVADCQTHLRNDGDSLATGSVITDGLPLGAIFFSVAEPDGLLLHLST